MSFLLHSIDNILSFIAASSVASFSNPSRARCKIVRLQISRSQARIPIAKSSLIRGLCLFSFVSLYRADSRRFTACFCEANFGSMSIYIIISFYKSLSIFESIKSSIKRYLNLQTQREIVLTLASYFHHFIDVYDFICLYILSSL